ncbi:hypothetical protein EDB89DRAFT_2071278 [Lactarius sanguifluus]|nr:hypothetical protein EDB89DRAFT_2071278 [Lactarius sanguifluus]
MDSLITTCNATFQAIFTFLTTLVQADILTIFTTETLDNIARRSLTGDSQDFNPLGGSRSSVAWLTTISVSQLPTALIQHLSLTIAPHQSHSLSLVCVHIHTHTHSLSLSLLPLITSVAHGPPSPVLALQEAHKLLVDRPHIPTPHVTLSLKTLSPSHHPSPFEDVKLVTPILAASPTLSHCRFGFSFPCPSPFDLIVLAFHLGLSPLPYLSTPTYFSWDQEGDHPEMEEDHLEVEDSVEDHLEEVSVVDLEEDPQEEEHHQEDREEHKEALHLG